MKNNLNAYYFILNQLFKDCITDSPVDLKTLLKIEEYDKNTTNLEKANKIALGHLGSKGRIFRTPLKTPFYKVEGFENDITYQPQSLTADFIKHMSDEKSENIKSDEDQWNAFIQDLTRNQAYIQDHPNQDIMWQETVETLALKHLSFIGIHTKKDNRDNKDRHPVSLFDHMRLTSAIYHVLKTYVAPEKNQEQKEQQDKPFLYIQGDFFGIQKFIFTDVNNTEKNAAKILRGRSAFVSILCELTAIKIINELKLPASARILTAAGKFHILAPNTDENIKALEDICKEIDIWFKQETYSIAGIGIAYEKLSVNDLDGTVENSTSKKKKKNQTNDKPTTKFSKTLKKLFDALAEKKYARLNLFSTQGDDSYIHSGYIGNFIKDDPKTPDIQPCDFMPYLPALIENQNYDNEKVSRLADIQINLGQTIPTSKYLVVYNKNKGTKLVNSKGNTLDILGYKIAILEKNDFNNQIKRIRDQVVRIYDIKDDEDSTGYTYGKKFLSAHTPAGKTFNDIARQNLHTEKNQDTGEVTTFGVPNIASLKGDIDNLGNIFQDTQTPITLARTLYRSRMLELYFSYRLSYLCEKENGGQFKNLYVVFAGGDDFFLLGCSKNIINFVDVFTKDFQTFTQNPKVHFSCGLGVFKSKHPVNYISSATEEFLEEAKKYQRKEDPTTAENPLTKNPSNNNPSTKKKNQADKNAICCYGQTVSFFQDKISLQETKDAMVSDWQNLIYIYHDFEEKKKLGHLLPTSSMYKWITFSQMAGDTKNYRNAIWRSQFTYQAVRLTDANQPKQKNANLKDTPKDRSLQNAQDYLIATVLGYIGTQKEAFKIPLFTYLYNNRKYEGTANNEQE